MARVLAVLLLVMVQAVLIVLLINAPWIERQCSEEQARVEAYLGDAREDRIQTRSRALYRRWVVESGMVGRSYGRLLPDRTVAASGMEGLAPWFFAWLERRLDAFWWLVYLAIYRAHLLLEWLPFVSALAGVATVDGLLQRQIRRASAGYASADRYTVARRALMVLSIAPLLYVLLPVSMHPVVVPAWGALLAIALAIFSANTQHQL